MKVAQRHSGFTLIELMIVVIIIAALASMVAPRLIDRSDEAKANISRGDLSSIDLALKLFRLDTGAYPTTQQGLEALMSQPSGAQNWKGPYLERKALDPWARPYRYKQPGQHNPATTCIRRVKMARKAPKTTSGTGSSLADGRTACPGFTLIELLVSLLLLALGLASILHAYSAAVSTLDRAQSSLGAGRVLQKVLGDFAIEAASDGFGPGSRQGVETLEGVRYAWEATVLQAPSGPRERLYEVRVEAGRIGSDVRLSRSTCFAHRVPDTEVPP